MPSRNYLLIFPNLLAQNSAGLQIRFKVRKLACKLACRNKYATHVVKLSFFMQLEGEKAYELVFGDWWCPDLTAAEYGSTHISVF